MAIEDEFGVNIDEKLMDWLVKERITFIDFIHFLEKTAQSGAPDAFGAGDVGPHPHHDSTGSQM